MAPAGGGASQRDFSQFVEDFLKHLFLLKIEKCTIFFSRIKFRTLGKYDGHFFFSNYQGVFIRPDSRSQAWTRAMYKEVYVITKHQ